MLKWNPDNPGGIMISNSTLGDEIWNDLKSHFLFGTPCCSASLNIVNYINQYRFYAYPNEGQAEDNKKVQSEA